MSERDCSERSQSTSLIICPSTRRHDLHAIFKGLESSDPEIKIQAMKGILALSSEGYRVESFLMPLVKFCLKEKNKQVKRMTLLCLEHISLLDKNNATLPESLLIVSSLRNDLQHPNEYMRCLTLRFVSKVTIIDIIDPLFSAILDCSSDPEAMVRYEAIITLRKVGQRFSEYVQEISAVLLQLLPDYQDYRTKHAILLALRVFNPAALFSSIAQEIQFLKRDGARHGDVAEAHHRTRFIVTILKLIRENRFEAKPVDTLHAFCRYCLTCDDDSIQIEAVRVTMSDPNSPIPTNMLLEALFQIISRSPAADVKHFALRLVQSIGKSYPLFDEFTDEIFTVFQLADENMRGIVCEIVRDIDSEATAGSMCEMLQRLVEAPEDVPQYDAVLEALHSLILSPARPLGNALEIANILLCAHDATAQRVYELCQSILEIDQAQGTVVIAMGTKKLSGSKNLADALRVASFLEQCAADAQSIREILACFIRFISVHLPELKNLDTTGPAVTHNNSIGNALLLLGKLVENGLAHDSTFLADGVIAQQVLQALDYIELHVPPSDALLARDVALCRYLLENPTSGVFNATHRETAMLLEPKGTSLQDKHTPHKFQQSLSSIADPIHVSVSASVQRCALVVEVTYSNRTASEASSVFCEFSLCCRGSGTHRAATADLQAYGSATSVVTIPLTRDSARVPVAALVRFTTTSGSHPHLFALQPLKIPLPLLMSSARISFDHFRALWARLEWQASIKPRPGAGPEACIDAIHSVIGAKVLRDSSATGALQSQVFAYGETIFRDHILLYLTTEKRAIDGTLCGKLTVRSSASVADDLVSALSQRPVFQRT